jgi:ATP-dependent Clp protease protease subunit
MNESKYTFNLAEEGKANLLINGEIDSYWGTGLREVADKIATSGASEIMVQLNSPGGSVTEGLAIASFLKGYPATIDTSIIGLSASIATTIALAGNKTSISEGSFFMIHNPWSFTAGESEDLRETADLLDKMKGELVNIYVNAIEKNGKLIDGDKEKTKEKVSELMDKETWFTAQETVDFGFIQEVTEAVEFMNKDNAKNIYNNCKNFKNVPTEFLNKIKTVIDMPTDNQKHDVKEEKEETSFFDKVKAWFKSNPEEAKELAEGIEKEQASKKEEEIAKAMEIAKANGFFKDEEEKAIEDNSNDLQKEVDSLKKTLKALETKMAAPTAGDGPTTETINNNIDKYAPTAKHKEAVDSFTKIFQ